jgi:hypothetical protein
MIQITAHAITRYIERVAPVSRDEALRAIMSHGKALEIASQLGNATVRDHGGVRYVVKDGHVVTVIGADCRFNHRAKAA